MNSFRSARLSYRALEPEDEAFVYELESEPLAYMMSNTGLLKPQAKRDTKKFQEWVSEKALLGVVLCLAVSENPDEVGKSIGVLNLIPPEEGLAHHRNTEMGLGILPAYQGKGYGTEAINWTLEWAFETAGMHKVMIKAYEFNHGARKLYERLGFKHEGTSRELWWQRGRWWDDYEYGMLEGEWRERRDAKETPLANR